MRTTAHGDRRLGSILERQWLHAVALVVLLSGCAWVAHWPALQQGALWGLASIGWFWIAILAAVVHQVYVWLCWRIELHGKGLTALLGTAAFPAFAFGFAGIGIARVLAMFALGYANQASVTVAPMALKIAAVVALVPALYLFYSVKRYFTFRRAFGADHFDPSVRSLPFVRGGIFRFTSNGMYVFGFLLLWVPGLWWASAGALCAALFNHLYIWVHHFATERPDIARIYGAASPQPAVENPKHASCQGF
jgi:Phospholipid methyltransferase